MRICANCAKNQNDTCTEDGMFVSGGGTCDKWQYHYEPLVFAVERMRKAQKGKTNTRALRQNLEECERRVDAMIENINTKGDME